MGRSQGTAFRCGHPLDPSNRYFHRAQFPTEFRCRMCWNEYLRLRKEPKTERRGSRAAPTCKNGHLRTPENVYSLRLPDGRVHRLCRPCKNECRRRRRAMIAA